MSEQSLHDERIAILPDDNQRRHINSLVTEVYNNERLHAASDSNRLPSSKSHSRKTKP